MKKFTKYMRLFASPIEVMAALKVIGKFKAGSHRDHLKLAGEWLLNAQNISGDGGYAHSYSLYGGWEKSYPETTGYIIPTMLQLANFLEDVRYRQSAVRAGEWLLEIQQSDGAFLDLAGNRQIFDTGQILEGLIALYETTAKNEFLASAIKAGDFLMGIQDADGAWTRYSYHKLPHTYYTRVAANLLKLNVASGELRFEQSAKKMLTWALGQQQANGYFRQMEFALGEPPYLHTIVYVLEGLLESYRILKDQQIYEALCKTVDALSELGHREGYLLYSQYNLEWRHPRNERCVTGLAQWAGLLVDMATLRGKPDFLSSARAIIEHLESNQMQAGGRNLAGALPGSLPLWGTYFRFAFNNWTVKFFVDALIKLESHQGASKTEVTGPK